MKLVIGSRGSKLALWQAHWVKGELERHGHTVEIEIIKTTGDRITDVPLAKVGTKGLFTKEIEDALLEGRVQLAVHSLKDLPTELPAGLVLGAVPAREDTRDALLARSVMRFEQLPSGARVGTSSLRRTAQMLHARPDLHLESLRGNLDTRIRKLDEGHYDAIILAAAGLKRLGWGERITELFEPDFMCPAVGQGALGIETRADDAKTLQALALLDNRAARLETTAERAMLGALGGGCQVPIGGSARAREDGSVHVLGIVGSPDGKRLLRATAEDAYPEAAGASVADQLLRGGGREILDAVYGRSAPVAESP